MKITIISVGKNNDGTVREGISEFTKRISRAHDIEWRFLAPSSKGGEIAVREEALDIENALRDGDFLVALDVSGKQYSTEQFAEFLQERLNTGTKRLVFLIGGAYGIAPSLLKRAQSTWSLSKLTFPHQLVRFILSEQLYRATSILRNEKYHHGA